MSKESEPNGVLTAPAEEAEGKRRLDPELRAIGAIIRILDDAREEGGVSSFGRIIRYLSDRYANPLVPLEVMSNR